MLIRSKRVLGGAGCSISGVGHYVQVEKKRKVSERKEADVSTDHQDQSDCCNGSAYQVLELEPCSSRTKTSSGQLPIDNVSPSTVRIVVPVSEVADARIPDRLVPELAGTWNRDVPTAGAAAAQTLDACSTSAESNSFVTESQLDTNEEEVCAEVQTTAGINPFDELRAFNAVKLAEKMSMKDEEFIGWLTDLKLVPRGRICDCGFEMRIYLSPEFDKQQWKCRRNACRRSKGLYTNTFFHNWRLPIKYLFKLSYYWCFGKLNVQRLRDELRKNGGRVPTHQTILSFNAFLRGVCSSYFRLNPLQLGGEGVRVNIERIIIAREPATIAGAVSKEHWGFCGEELGSNVCFIEEIDEESSPSLNSNSLLMVIDRYIRPGTMIVSTLWKKYEVNGELPEAFKHLARQRSIRFIEAENEQCENDIPMLWDKFKRIQYKGLDRTPLICAYIKEFMWRQLFGGDDCMYHLWSHIASMYPL